MENNPKPYADPTPVDDESESTSSLDPEIVTDYDEQVKGDKDEEY